ncbi:MAG TPA: cation:proton antiporter [Bacteroidia bacterium]|nr:cation:proton antiporter [Bacteroidia bacterium]
MKRSSLLYAVLIGFFAYLIWFVIDSGKNLKPQSTPTITSEQTFNKTVKKSKPVVISSNESVTEQFLHNIKSPLGLLLLQIITILFVSKLFGAVITRIGQPSVIGEMIAGIFLGPSIMGLLFPAFSEFLFPKSSLNNLQFLSQIGLAFFMFIIGMELDIEKLKNKAYNAIVISHASIIFPYFLGVSVSYFLYEEFAPANVSFTAFALFMGIAVSITAFPVLARILQERGLTKTSLGAIVITCAAFDDVTAWCILAIVIAIAKAGTIASALFTIVLTVIFILIMLYAVKPWIKKVSSKYGDSKNLNKTLVVIVFFVLLLSACITEAIGIHALFGAFLAGVIMPQKVNVKELLMEKIEDVSILLLLPLFFAFTGLRTQIGLLNDGSLWTTCGLIIFIAVLGKFGGSAFAAKLTGQSWKDSFSIGALMNTRGLMELIVLNIGYDLGILSPVLFAIMVLMALITTFMTGPLLSIISKFSPVSKEL